MKNPKENIKNFMDKLLKFYKKIKKNYKLQKILLGNYNISYALNIFKR